MVNDFNEALSAAVRAEHRAHGWSVEELGARLPKGGDLSARTLYRLVAVRPSTDRNKPEWKASYIALTATALGMSASELVAAAEHRAEPGRVTPRKGEDPRTLIQFLMTHPDEDGVLQARLGELRRDSGSSGRTLAQVEREMVLNRRSELGRALEALPPARAN